MNMKHVATIAVVAVLAIAVLATLRIFPSRQSSQPAIPLIIVRVPVPYSGLLDIAAAKGFFAAEGLAVTIKTADTGPAAINAVLSGEAAVGTTAETPIANAMVAGKKLKIIATIFSSAYDPGIVARRDHGISQPSDLKGKRIATVPGTAAHYLLDIYLAFHDIPVESITRVDMKPDQIASAITSGDVDAVAIWNPHLLKTSNKLGSNALILPSNEIYALVFNLVIAPETLSRHREAIDRLLRALLRAEAFARTQQSEAVSIVASTTGSSAHDIQAQWNSLSYELALRQSLILAIENESRWILRRGYVPGGSMPDALGAIESEPLKLLRPSSVSIAK